MKKLQLLYKYILYWMKAKRIINQSAFIHEVVSVIHDTTPFYFFEQMDVIRDELEKNFNYISITDLGAGSSVNPSLRRTIADIARNTCISKKQGELLFRLVNYFKPKILIELGTSLGMSTAYQAGCSNTQKIYSFEGCPKTAKVAQNNLHKLQLNNVAIITGNFDKTLPEFLTSVRQIDYVLFDGNHRKMPTLNYFNQCLRLAHNDTLFVFADIHWSNEMEEAWEEIKQHPKVTVTLDLFFYGLVLFKENQTKQHFFVRF